VKISINISSIRLRKASSQDVYGNQISFPDNFRIETRDDTGRLIDRAYAGVPSPPLSPNSLTMVSVLPFTFAESTAHTLSIRFKTFNQLESGGLLRIKLPTGYSYNRETLKVVEATSSGLGDELNIGHQGPLKGLAYLPEYPDNDASALWFRISSDLAMPDGAQRLVMFLSPVRTTQTMSLNATFQVSTLTSNGAVIDEDLKVLGYDRVPGLLTSAFITPNVFTAGAVSDITIGFTTSGSLPNKAQTVVYFPPSYSFRKAVNTQLPVKSIYVDGACKCGDNITDFCLNRCQSATFRNAPAPIPDVRAVSPVAGYNDKRQLVTVYGIGFGGVGGVEIRARLGGVDLPTILVRTDYVVVVVDCSEQKRANNTFCSLQLPTGVSTAQNCKTFFGVGEAFSTTKCLASTEESFAVSMMWTAAIEFSVSYVGYPSNGYFTNTKTNYTLYRRNNDPNACPGDCDSKGNRGICAKASSTNDFECRCFYPFEGIDCKTGPDVLRLNPDFGSHQGGGLIEVELRPGVPLTSTSRTYRTVSVFITLNQGSSCEVDGCCSTSQPCFGGLITQRHFRLLIMDANCLFVSVSWALESLWQSDTNLIYS
jgi:hypothetical protein